MHASKASLQIKLYMTKRPKSRGAIGKRKRKNAVNVLIEFGFFVLL
jgi:hypothetical protein